MTKADRNDPDETPGRLLYRQLAEAEARRAIALTRRVTLAFDDVQSIEFGTTQSKAPPRPILR